MKALFDNENYQKIEKWIETIFLSLCALGVGYLYNRSDPFFVQGRFPWIWFAPLLIALRYGIAPGMVSVFTICMSYLAMLKMGLLSVGFPVSFMLGGVLQTLICGQFSTLWDTRLRRANQLSEHAGVRFEQLSRAYFMVRLSHDRLEQNLISRPVTLRDALIDLRTQLASHGGRLDGETGAALISLLVHYCGLESASLYLCINGFPESIPLASCGKGAPMNLKDLLLRSVLERGTTAYQSINRLPDGEESAYLVAAPLRTSSGTLLGVLLISEMPFLSLHREALQILGVLLAYTADHSEAAMVADKILIIYPDCPPMFALELVKMIRLRRDLDVTSALVTINIKPVPRLEQICSTMERQQRGLDHMWRRGIGWGVQFVTLMPFSGAASIEGFRARIDNQLKQQFGMTTNSDTIFFHFRLIEGGKPYEQLADLLAEAPL